MENQWLADRFEEHRPRSRAVAYRMLASLLHEIAARSGPLMVVTHEGVDVGDWPSP